MCDVIAPDKGQIKASAVFCGQGAWMTQPPPGLNPLENFDWMWGMLHNGYRMVRAGSGYELHACGDAEFFSKFYQ
jgi:hypothetical protein